MFKCFKFLPALFFLLCFAEAAPAQGSFFTGNAYRYTPAGIFAASGASVTVCTSAGAGAPCTPTISVFKDSALVTPVTNPLPVCGTPLPQFGCIDGLGNFSFYASTTGPYTYTITGAGLTAYGPIPIGAVTSGSLNTANNWTASQIFSAGIIAVAPNTLSTTHLTNATTIDTLSGTVAGNPTFSATPTFSGSGPIFGPSSTPQFQNEANFTGNAGFAGSAAGWFTASANSNLNCLGGSYNLLDSGFCFTRTIGSGTVTTAGTTVNAGVSQAQTGITITGATVTDTATCALNAAPAATWQTGIQLLPPVVTSNTVTVWLSNPTAGNITPAATVVRCTVTR